MLRIFKLRSPMSVGTWVLVIFSGFCTRSVVAQAAGDNLLNQWKFSGHRITGKPVRWLGVAGVPFGFLLGGYTGVLLAATAVPLWTKNALLMGPLFLASAASNATALITLVLCLGKAPHRALVRLERLEMCSLVTELGLLALNRKQLGQRIGTPLREGSTGQLYRFGVQGTGIAAPLVFTVAPMLAGRKPSRWRAALSSVLTLSGGFMFRYVMVVAGHRSADDPQATFELARRGSQEFNEPITDEDAHEVAPS
jgi:formate-dependent nitrite reductase membrane component NrfD